MKYISILWLIMMLSTFSFAQNNYSVEFDGSNDYVDVPYNTSQDFGTGPMTYECWFKKSTTTHDRQTPLITNSTTSPVPPLLGFFIGGVLEPYTGKLHFHYRTINSEEFGLKSTITVDDNLWHHAAAVKDAVASTISIYIDGEFDSSMGITNGNADPMQGFRSGGGILGRYMDVKIDEMRVWNIALSENQINDYMNCPPSANETGLIMYWDFEEGMNTTAFDKTVNGNDGTLINGTSWSSDVPPFQCPLPIELITFKGTMQDKKAVLTWCTTSEGNNTGFEVLRSTDNRDLTKIGWVENQGNSPITLTYSFEDKDILPNVDYYYRLKQIDLDGNYEYSPVIVLRLGDNLNNITFAPNPVSNGLTYLHFNTTQAEQLNIMLFDAIGKPVYSKDTKVTDGFNQIELDITALPKGIYFTWVKTNNHTTYKQLLMNR